MWQATWIEGDAATVTIYELQNWLYVKPWGRCLPFGVGAAAALGMPTIKAAHQRWTERQAEASRSWLNWIVVQMLVIASAACLAAVIWMGYGATIWNVKADPPTAKWTDWEIRLYLCLKPLVWSMGLVFIIIAANFSPPGHGGIAVALLEWAGWQPLSKLTYCVYLIHPAFIFAFYQSDETHKPFSYRSVALHFSFFCIAVYSLAVTLTLLIELPGTNLNAMLLKCLSRQRDGQPAQQAQQTNEGADDQLDNKAKYGAVNSGMLQHSFGLESGEVVVGMSL